MIEIALSLLLAVAAAGAVGRWIPLPLPILLVIGGIGLSFVPGLDELRIEPDVFFLLFIPPLLFADGWLISKRDFLQALRPILLLAFGLVLMTTVLLGYFMHWLIPALPLAVAFALGAVISPTDAVAVSATTEALAVPERVTNILKGESLINDASGLVAFTFAVAAVSTGRFEWGGAAFKFVVLSAGGFVVGLTVAWSIGHVKVALRRLSVDDPSVQTMLSLLTPYAAYLAAETLHVGGILAVVAAGLHAGIHDQRNFGMATRRHAFEVWAMVLFVFNGLAFLLLGIELRSVVSGVTRAGVTELIGYALLLSAAVVAIRLLWVFPAAYLPIFLSERIRKREGVHDPRAVFVVGWAGIRGTVTLAAALSLPYTTASGAPFPGRDLVILLAAAVIVFTLLVNGLSLPWWIRFFGLRGDGSAEREERAARIATTQAALGVLRQSLARAKGREQTTYVNSLIELYERRMGDHTANAARRRDLAGQRAFERQVKLDILSAEREELLSMVRGGVINDEVLRIVQNELDHAESLTVNRTPARAAEAPRREAK